MKQVFLVAIFSLFHGTANAASAVYSQTGICGETFLHYLVEKDKIHALFDYVMLGQDSINFNAKDLLEDTAIQSVCFYGSLRMFCSLFVLGASLDNRNWEEKDCYRIIG